MKLLTVQSRQEGERVPDAWISLWWLRTHCLGRPKLRSFGIAIYFPWTVDKTFLDFETGSLRAGKRRYRLYLRGSLVNHSWQKPGFGCFLDRVPVTSILIATREQLEDGEIEL